MRSFNLTVDKTAANFHWRSELLSGVNMQAKAVAISALAMLVTAASCSQNPANVELQFSTDALEKRQTMFEHVASLKADPENPNALGWWNQMVAAVGREDLLAGSRRTYDNPASLVCTDEASANAIEGIIGALGDQNVVIINENHAMPAHRVFIRELVIQLRTQGFTHYAAETLSAVAASGTGYPSTDDGWYTSEPLMARLLKTVRDLGYIQIAYEQTAEQAAPPEAEMQTRIETRENAQVANLKAAVLDDNRDIKIIVHVGHSHVAEEPVYGTEWMAARLKKATGIDPFTISLLACRSSSNVPVLSQTALDINGDAQPRYTDYLVGLPSFTFENGRPSYRAAIGDIATKVPAALLPVENPVIIEARPIDASLNQEPVERLYLAPGENLPLMLPSGTWSLISFDEEGSISGPEIVSIED